MSTNRTRVTGMYSGLDTESLITQLVEAKSVKVNDAKKDQMSIKYKQDAWDELNKKIKSLYSTVSNLQYESAYAKKTTNVSDSSVASVVTADDAMLSTQTLKVNKLATSGYLTGARIETQDDTKATSGTLLSKIKGVNVGDTISIEANGKTKDITITDKMTLGDLTSELSAAGATAKFDTATQRLFIGAKESGEKADFSITGSADSLKALGLDTSESLPEDKRAVKIKGQDAEIELNGAKFTSKTNTFEVNGLTITAKAQTGKNETVTLDTTNDTSAVYDMIKKFVTEYTSLANELDKLYNVKADKSYKPLTDDEKAVMSEYEIEKWEDKLKEQALAKDSNVNSVASTLRDVFNKGFEIGGKTMYLFDFGIEAQNYTEAPENEKHALHIKGDSDDSVFANDTNLLQKMITANPNDVKSFFSQLNHELYTTMGKMSSRVTDTRSFGNFYDDIKLKNDYSDYNSKITSLEAALTAYEDKWYDKFSAMEKAMANMQSNQNAISGLLGN